MHSQQLSEKVWSLLIFYFRGGVAVRIGFKSSQNDEKQATGSRSSNISIIPMDGRAFTFLPLPLQTGS